MTTKTKCKKTPIRTRKQRGGDKFTVYIAGDLWTHKDLIGNALLGDAIDKQSKGKYKCILPQDLESPENRDVDIRNVDLKGVMACDMAIFNFDGTDLDSGTVVEFIYAKMLDIPCVILRTDFRSSGEGNQDQDPWNLMATHWPRTNVLNLNGMLEYQTAKSTSGLAKTIEKMYKKLASQLIKSLDAVRKEKPLASASENPFLFDWAVRCPGGGYNTLFEEGELERLIATKVAKGLLSK